MVTVYRRRLNSCIESSSFGHCRLTNDVVEGRWSVLQRPSRSIVWLLPVEAWARSQVDGVGVVFVGDL